MNGNFSRDIVPQLFGSSVLLSWIKRTFEFVDGLIEQRFSLRTLPADENRLPGSAEVAGMDNTKFPKRAMLGKLVRFSSHHRRTLSCPSHSPFSLKVTRRAR